MEDQKADISDHPEASSDKAANASTRAGALAKGGITAQPGDPTSPKQAAARSAKLNQKMREAGFGDHKGETMGDDGTKTP